MPGRRAEPEHEELAQAEGLQHRAVHVPVAEHVRDQRPLPDAFELVGGKRAWPAVEDPVAVVEIGDELLAGRAGLVRRAAVPGVHLRVDDQVALAVVHVHGWTSPFGPTEYPDSATAIPRLAG
ncbi:hypothetical protein [Pseudonocardia sp. T1-2H]|uniref:hypothetical protein n=1 Tax=Pseudonocardia sp. T1-2H TaxID=3128899 RepID=UPI0031015E9F